MSDHLGDTNKMVETPRTDGLLTEILDAYGYVHQGNCPQRWVNHARELERELNAASVEIEEKRKDIVWLATEKAKLEDRIKRLEEAGDALEYASVILEAGEDPNGFEKLLIAQRAWRKAKEAKP